MRLVNLSINGSGSGTNKLPVLAKQVNEGGAYIYIMGDYVHEEFTAVYCTESRQKHTVSATSCPTYTSCKSISLIKLDSPTK